MKAGALDFIEKPAGRDELIAGIERALEVSEDSSKLTKLRETAAGRLAGLTPRQSDVMERVLAGQPSKNIAADLDISEAYPPTRLRSHRSRAADPDPARTTLHSHARDASIGVSLAACKSTRPKTPPDPLRGVIVLGPSSFPARRERRAGKRLYSLSRTVRLERYPTRGIHERGEDSHMLSAFVICGR